MTILAYVFIAAFILLFGGIFFGVKQGESRPEHHYPFLFVTFLVVGFTGLLMSLGVLGLLPELVWS